MEIKITVLCDLCKEEMKAEFSDVYGELHVVPCERCKSRDKECYIAKVRDKVSGIGHDIAQKVQDDVDRVINTTSI